MKEGSNLHRTIVYLLLGTMLAVLTATLQASAQAAEPRAELLWPSGAPSALGTAGEDKPSIEIYVPSTEAVPTAVVVCPGGGYQGLALDHEGKQIAEWLNSLGITAFVLKYRLGPRYHHPIELGDAQRALRLVRSRSQEFRIDPARIGIWGFSAGGHLAATAATHFDSGKADAGDPIDRVSSRPDFAILCYAVITMSEPYGHQGSRIHLLGDNPDPKLIEYLSNEKQVTDQTPPTFLFHTSDDSGVPSENSVMFYSALVAHHVPAELHIFEHGPHGVGLAQTQAALSIWPTLLENWLRVRGLLR